MKGRPDFTRIEAYALAPEAAPKPPARPVRASPRRMAQMPTMPLANNTWRAWASYILTRRDELPEKDERHLRVCIAQRSYLTKAQIRWIFDIVSRMEPSGCDTWGAPT